MAGNQRRPPARIRIPRSARTGIGWPALPAPADAVVLAIQYQLERTQWLPPRVLETLQHRQLELLLAHAAETVPFYADRLRALGPFKRGSLTAETWRRLPVLRRAEVQEAGEALVTRRLPKDHEPMAEVTTSGSTGRPIAVKSTRVTGLFFRALSLRYHLWAGRDFSATVAGIRSLSGAMAEAAKTDKPLGWVPGHRSGPMFFFDISRPVAEQLDWLVAKNPVYLLTNPSNLRALIERSQTAGARLALLKQVATMGEILDEDVRALCQTAWGVPVVDAYSAEEAGMIALQCPRHPHYHVQAESVRVEILDEADQTCAPGQTGRIVVTDLHNFAAPLLRYELGDYAEVGEPCPCRRGLPVLRRILGRSRNMLTLPSGDRQWPNLPPKPLTTIAPIRQFQLVQTSLEAIEVRLVMPRPLTPDEEKRLTAYFHENFRHPFVLKYVYVDEIPRAASGKYEGFISAIA